MHHQSTSHTEPLPCFNHGAGSSPSTDALYDRAPGRASLVPVKPVGVRRWGSNPPPPAAEPDALTIRPRLR
ncbi:hypothetical protein MTO96_045479, partial [Rhipicephalus appendiculatus]